jgi:hypothetical protein
MFCKCKEDMQSLRDQMQKLETRQMDFLIKAHEIMKTITDNDKKKFMYELHQEDIELIEEGKKVRAIRKIVS